MLNAEILLLLSALFFIKINNQKGMRYLTAVFTRLDKVNRRIQLAEYHLLLRCKTEEPHWGIFSFINNKSDLYIIRVYYTALVKIKRVQIAFRDFSTL